MSSMGNWDYNKAAALAPSLLAMLFFWHEQPVQHQIYQAQQNGADEGGEKSAHLKSRHKQRGQLKYRCIDEEPENAQSQHGERQSDQLEQHPECSVDEAYDQGRQKDHAQSTDAKTGQQVSD